MSADYRKRHNLNQPVSFRACSLMSGWGKRGERGDFRARQKRQKITAEAGETKES